MLYIVEYSHWIHLPPLLLPAEQMTAKEKHATQLFFKGLRVKGQPNTVSPLSASKDLHKSGGDEDPAERQERDSAGHEPSTQILKGRLREPQLPILSKRKALRTIRS